MARDSGSGLSITIQHGYLAHMMLRSVELFWPKGLGKVVAILDHGEDHLAAMLPGWVTTVMKQPESELNNLDGWLAKEYWNLWADRFTTADYVAFMDTDAPLITLVTPDMLFRDKKLIAVGGRSEYFTDSDKWLLGSDELIGDFMSTLPWVVPRQILPKMRAYLEQVHHDKVG